MTDVGAAIVSLQKSEESYHRLIIAILVVLVIIGIILHMFYMPYYKSGLRNYMLPSERDKYVELWKANGANDEQIQALINEYFPSNRIDWIRMWKTARVSDKEIDRLLNIYFPHNNLKEKYYTMRELGGIDAEPPFGVFIPY